MLNIKWATLRQICSALLTSELILRYSAFNLHASLSGLEKLFIVTDGFTTGTRIEHSMYRECAWYRIPFIRYHDGKNLNWQTWYDIQASFRPWLAAIIVNSAHLSDDTRFWKAKTCYNASTMSQVFQLKT